MEIGVFIPIGRNGWIISTTSPQYNPSFELNKQTTLNAERYGFDFALSMIKLRGFGGKSGFWDQNLESFTLMAGLAAVTSRIKLYATVPTLVIHTRDDARVPFSLGREFATGIPGARFVSLESRNHILLESEPAWARFRTAFDEFIGGTVTEGDYATRDASFGVLTARELDILCHVARGLSNAEIAERVFISEKTVRNHLTNIFSKLDVDSRAKAIVRARQGGLVR